MIVTWGKMNHSKESCKEPIELDRQLIKQNAKDNKNRMKALVFCVFITIVLYRDHIEDTKSAILALIGIIFITLKMANKIYKCNNCQSSNASNNHCDECGFNYNDYRKVKVPTFSKLIKNLILLFVIFYLVGIAGTIGLLAYRIHNDQQINIGINRTQYTIRTINDNGVQYTVDSAEKLKNYSL